MMYAISRFSLLQYYLSWHPDYVIGRVPVTQISGGNYNGTHRCDLLNEVSLSRSFLLRPLFISCLSRGLSFRPGPNIQLGLSTKHYSVVIHRKDTRSSKGNSAIANFLIFDREKILCVSFIKNIKKKPKLVYL